MEIQNPSPHSKGTRLKEIDELKGFAILLVILYHAGGVLNWDNWLHGEVGVDIFLIASGFTLALNSRELPVLEFVKHRFLRIFPAYWISLATYVVLNDRFFGSNYSATSVVIHLFGLHGFVSGEYFSDINDSFWFISLILALYVVFLAIRRRLADISYVIGVGMITTVCACLAYISGEHAGGLIQLAVRIPSFFLGLVCGQIWSAATSVFTLSPHLAIGLIAITYLGWTKGIITFYAVAGAGLSAAFLVAARLFRRVPEGRFTLAVLSFAGIYSYEIFLFHQPLMRDFNFYVFRNWLRIEPTAVQLCEGIICALAVTLGVSVAIHKLTGVAFGVFRRSPKGIGRPTAAV